jgi:hypothetical protein
MKHVHIDTHICLLSFAGPQRCGVASSYGALRAIYNDGTVNEWECVNGG